MKNIFIRQLSFWLYSFILVLPSALISPKGLVRSLYALLILYAFVNSKKLAVKITGIFLLLVPAALYLQHTFKAPMNESFWIIIFSSNPGESFDFLRTVSVWPFLLFIGLVTFWTFLVMKLPNEPIFRLKGLRYFCFALLLVPVVHTVKGYPTIYNEFNHHFTESFPLNIFLSYPSAVRSHASYEGIQIDEEALANLSASSKDDSSIYVLVIGESARRDRLELYGAKTPNNPYLKKRTDEIYVFNDFITLHPHTASSLPVILANDSGVETDIEYTYSVTSVFKKAGFKTYWISNQASLSSGGKVGRYSKEADYRKFFHIHESSAPNTYDSEVLEDFRALLREPDKKKFFILHLQGSHYTFAKRYPREFNKFNDTYDNSLLYTDYILAEVINELENTQGVSALMYVSDHGLLFDACGKKYTHFDNKESFEVPFIAWTSKTWNSENPKAREMLNSKLSAPLTTKVVFGTLLDIANIDYSSSELYPSIISSESFDSPRIVRTYSQSVNYDLGYNNSECHLVD